MQPAWRHKLIFGNMKKTELVIVMLSVSVNLSRARAREHTHTNDRAAQTGKAALTSVCWRLQLREQPMKTAHQHPWRMFWKPQIQQQHQKTGSRYEHTAISPATSDVRLIIHTQARYDCQASNNVSNISCPSLCVPACSPREAAHVQQQSLKYKE